MLMKVEDSCLLVVDVQERLLPVIHESERVVENARWLIGVARRLEVPVLVSEQYPRGLGHSAPELLEAAPEGAVMEKIHFSCADSPECRERIHRAGRRQVVVAGIEAHVCVLQTALGLLGQGLEVYVVADAVSSRRREDAELALARLRAEGVRVVGREMVAFEWLHRAGTDTFREVSKQYLR